VREYVRTGKAQMQFENLSFIGPDSVQAGQYAAAAAAQNKLWNFVDLMYLNQGTENTGYVTATYLRQLLEATPGLNVAAALSASQTSAASEALTQASRVAAADGINATPSFLIGRTGGPLRQFQPPTLTAAPFAAALNSLLRGSK
jgi:protein-disulfide isomerase